jgi:transcriptional regulator with XRE-family HTH domain
MIELWRKRLKRLRIANGFTGEQLADKAKITQGSVSLIETGRRMPTLPTLSKILKALDADFADIFGPESGVIDFSGRIIRDQLKTARQILNESRPKKGRPEKRKAFKQLHRLLAA